MRVHIKVRDKHCILNSYTYKWLLILIPKTNQINDSLLLYPHQLGNKLSFQKIALFLLHTKCGFTQ